MAGLRWLVAGVLRTLLLAVIWAGLSGGAANHAVYGMISVPAAVALSLGLLPPGRRHVRSLPSRVWHASMLAGWFLRQSSTGGVDVAVRALRPRPDIAPTVVPAPLRLPEGHARQTAMLLMNLMPGSMAQRVVTATGETAEDAGSVAVTVELHTLSRALEPAAQWSELEQRVGMAFGIEPTDRSARPGGRSSHDS